MVVYCKRGHLSLSHIFRLAFEFDGQKILCPTALNFNSKPFPVISHSGEAGSITDNALTQELQPKAPIFTFAGIVKPSVL